MAEIIVEIELDRLAVVEKMATAVGISPGVLLQAAIDYGVNRIPEAVSERMASALNETEG